MHYYIADIVCSRLHQEGDWNSCLCRRTVTVVMNHQQNNL